MAEISSITGTEPFCKSDWIRVDVEYSTGPETVWVPINVDYSNIPEMLEFHSFCNFLGRWEFCTVHRNSITTVNHVIWR